jgi:hypothetical protein
MRPSWKKIILHIFLPLVVGLIIYMIVRPDNWIVRQLFQAASHQKNIVTSSSPWYARWIAYSGSDFCWSYSFASALFFWKKADGSIQWWFVVMVVLLVVFFELVQLLFPTQFTFDEVDLAAAFGAVILSWLLNKPHA